MQGKLLVDFELFVSVCRGIGSFWLNVIVEFFSFFVYIFMVFCLEIVFRIIELKTLNNQGSYFWSEISNKYSCLAQQAEHRKQGKKQKEESKET